MKRFSIITLLLLCVSNFAVNENELLQKLPSDIFPYWNTGSSQTYKGVDDKSVHYHAIRREDLNPTCALVILPGRTEPTTKYVEVAYDLKELNCATFLWDPRGQGLSERLLGDPQKGYVEKYEDYLSDFDKFYKKELANYKKVAIVGHSMGAAIGLASVATYNYPIAGMVLSSPMMQIKTNNLPEFAALTAMNLLKLVGKKTDYIPGGGPFLNPETFEENRVTSSKPRFQMALDAFANTAGENLYMGAATNNWLKEGIKLTHFLKRKKTRKKLENIPLVIYQAGKDSFSKDRRQRRFCEKLPKCQFIRLEKAKHEMFQERDELRDPVMLKTKSFLSSLLDN